MANLTTSTDIDTFMGSADNAAARTNLGVTAFDPASPGTLGGTTPAVNVIAVQFTGKDGAGAGATGGPIFLNGGDGISANSGGIQMSGGPSDGASGGGLNTSGGSLPGGGISTANGGGSIDTTGTGSIQFGVNGTRTSLLGNATNNRIITFPDQDGVVALGAGVNVDTGWTAAASSGDKTDSVSNYSGAGIDGTMASALNLVSAGLGDALQQDEARIKELINFCQALQTALVNKLLPNA